jgi:hypothetical protein
MPKVESELKLNVIKVASAESLILLSAFCKNFLYTANSIFTLDPTKPWTLDPFTSLLSSGEK